MIMKIWRAILALSSNKLKYLKITGYQLSFETICDINQPDFYEESEFSLGKLVLFLNGG